MLTSFFSLFENILNGSTGLLPLRCQIFSRRPGKGGLSSVSKVTIKFSARSFAYKSLWERYYHLVALFLAAVTTGYYLFGIRQPKRILHEAGDYIHFMALVVSLFVVAGGIHVQIRGRATPFFNCVLLFLGTIAGNVLGTIGASMLFIRPWIRVNKYRYTGLHTAFFLFLVSNLGGGLTPMEPPPFLGYLKGVPFWWIVQHCWLAWSVALLSLLLTFYLVDRHNFRRAPAVVREEETASGKIRIDGLRNIFFLASILG